MKYKLKKKVSLFLLVLIVLMPIGYSEVNLPALFFSKNSNNELVISPNSCAVRSAAICEITNVYWEITKFRTEKYALRADMVVEGTKGCMGEDIDIILWEDDILDDRVSDADLKKINFPKKVRFNTLVGNTAKVIYPWSVGSLKYDIFTKSEIGFYFTAAKEGKTISSEEYIDDGINYLYPRKAVLELENMYIPPYYFPDETDAITITNIDNSDLTAPEKFTLKQLFFLSQMEKFKEDSSAYFHYRRQIRQVMLDFINQHSTDYPSEAQALKLQLLKQDSLYVLGLAAQASQMKWEIMVQDINAAQWANEIFEEELNKLPQSEFDRIRQQAINVINSACSESARRQTAINGRYNFEA